MAFDERGNSDGVVACGCGADVGEVGSGGSGVSAPVFLAGVAGMSGAEYVRLMVAYYAACSDFSRARVSGDLHRFVCGGTDDVAVRGRVWRETFGSAGWTSSVVGGGCCWQSLARSVECDRDVHCGTRACSGTDGVGGVTDSAGGDLPTACAGASGGDAVGRGCVGCGTVGSGDGRGGTALGVETVGVVDGALLGSKASCATGGAPGDRVPVVLGPNGGRSYGRGKNYERNQQARDSKRQARGASGSWRSPGSVQSSQGSGTLVGTCWTVKEESPMEKRIREALEKKKAVEAELAAKKAELALARMNDKTMTDLYNDRVKQETICRMNQATQKSEGSLEQLRSVSPGSSATPGEIREALLYSEEWKVKEGKIRAWIAKGDLEKACAVLDEKKDVEAETLNTEERDLVAEWAPCEIVEEERVEPSALEKANVTAALLWSQKKYIAFVARRCREMGKDPESGLLGPEIGVYRGMTVKEFADFDAL